MSSGLGNVLVTRGLKRYRMSTPSGRFVGTTAR
jgi:hypothetical protein